MRIARLDLVAFGPFSERSLDLSGGMPGGLHLVYGKNAAGKSSALRAVTDLLFGIPPKSNDDHVHPYQSLRIRALLERSNGERLLVQRLKRGKDSLRDEHDAPLDEALLKTLLGGVDRAMFERVFGLDHERLRDAGRTLLEGGGDVGESLFDAGAGGQGVRRVLARLREDADRLFKPRGGKQEIAQLLEKYKLARERVRNAAHAPEAYTEQQRELERRGHERETLARELSELRREREHSRLLQATLKSVAQRERVLADLRLLGTLPELPPNFSELRERVQTELLSHRANVERAQREIQRLTLQREGLNPPTALLAVGEQTMTLLRERIGSTKKALMDLPAREAALREGHAEAQIVERRLGLDAQGTNEALRARRPEEARFRKLLAERGALVERRRAASDRLRQAELDCEIHKARLATLPDASDVQALDRAVRLARQVGDVDAALASVRCELAELDALSATELGALGPFEGSLAELCRLRVPGAEAVLRFERAFARSDERIKGVLAESERQRQRAAELSSELAAEERAGAAPTEAELERVRHARDERFDQLWERWSEPAPQGPSPLDAVRLREYRSAVVAADTVADRLRREAARIAENARRMSELARIEDEQRRLGSLEAELRREAEAIERDWTSNWPNVGLAVIKPSEARAWLARREHAVSLVARAAALREREATLSGQAAELGASLRQALGTPPAASRLTIDVARANEKLQHERELARDREALTRQISELEVRVTAARRDLMEREREAEAREAELMQAIVALGFEPSVAPEEVETRLEALSDLFRTREQTRELERRILGMKRDIAAFESDVRALVREHAPELTELPAERAASELVARFERARRDAEALQRVLSELAERQVELEEQAAELTRAEQALQTLMTTAMAADATELPAIENKTRRARELRAELDGLEATLGEAAGAHGLSSLLEQAAATDRARIAARLQELDQAIEQLEEQHNDSIRAQQSLLAGLERFADTNAAEAADEERSLASALVVRAERWSKLKLAEVLLAREIERYRQEHQGPVLRRAAELFVRLTQRQYRGLRIGVEERTLVAVRGNDAEVTVEGLNEAARYHLYLALRLASLERYLEHAEPLPLVLDDILIHFDEEGARAALAVLGEIAQGVQVLLFTHHRHNLELAEAAVTRERLFVHEL